MKIISQSYKRIRPLGSHFKQRNFYYPVGQRLRQITRGVVACSPHFTDLSRESEIGKTIYNPSFDVEDHECYMSGGYHPVIIGDAFLSGRYRVIHKLGYGGYSTTWLAQDQKTKRYVSVKILVASSPSKSNEGDILRLLHESSARHSPTKSAASNSVNPSYAKSLILGEQFVPHLIESFYIDGPNGQHLSMVQEPARCNIADSKELATDLMFPVETARSIAAQLIMGIAYIHARGVCHGGKFIFIDNLYLHLRNFLLYSSRFEGLSAVQIYEQCPVGKSPIFRLDGRPVEPRAPPYTVTPLRVDMAADKVVDPIVKISDYGTSFVVETERTPKLYSPSLYLPPEDFFEEPITLAADIWALGVSLYEVLGERPLFESFCGDRDDLLGDTINTLGLPPVRWWKKWRNRHEFYRPDRSWVEDMQRIYTPVTRQLHQRMWDMGRGDTPETCTWNVKGGEMRALENMLRSMLAYEPAKRATADQLLASEYMTDWAMPAWERQVARQANSSNQERSAPL